MTTASPITSSIAGLPSVHKKKKFVSRLDHFCTKIENFCEKEVFYNCTLFTLNSIVLLSKIFKKIPPLLSNTAMTILGYMGIATLSFQIDNLKHLFKRTGQAFKAKDSPFFIELALKISLLTFNFFLNLASSGMMLFAPFFPPSAFTSTFWITLGVLGIISSCIDIPLKILDIALFDHYSKKLKGLLKHSPEKKNLYLEHLNNLQKKETSTHSLSPKEKTTLQRVYFLYGTQSEYKLKKIFDEKQKINKEKAVSFHLTTEKIKKIAELLRDAFGWISLYLCKIFPNTLLQATLAWTTNVMYTLPSLISTLKPRKKTLSLS